MFIGERLKRAAQPSNVASEEAEGLNNLKFRLKIGLLGIAIGGWQHMEAIENQVAHLQKRMGRLREVEHDIRAEREGNDGSFIGI